MNAKPSELWIDNACLCTACVGVAGVGLPVAGVAGRELDEDEPAVRVREVKHGPFRLFCFEYAPLDPDPEILVETECSRCDRPMFVDVDFR